MFVPPVCKAAAERFALPALGQGRRSRPARKMIRRRKLLEIAAESPASGARFVGWRCFANALLWTVALPLYQIYPESLLSNLRQ